MKEEPEFIVDLSNVVFTNKTTKKGKIENYYLIKRKFTAEFPKSIVIYVGDASLRGKINNAEEYENLITKDGIIQTPSKEEADYYILKYAKNKLNCIVISRDRFTDYKIGKKFKKRIIPFTIIKDEFLFSGKLYNLLNKKDIIHKIIVDQNLN